jgi:hypothetical protein
MTTSKTEDEVTPASSVKPLRSINEIISDLSKPISARHLQTKRQGGTDLTFIPWYHAVSYLDLYAPGWSYDIEYQGHTPEPTKLTTDKKSHRGKVIVKTTITIPCLEAPEFGIVRSALGIEDDVVTGYGDPTSNAESMALRRAAAKFGLGRYLYNTKD